MSFVDTLLKYGPACTVAITLVISLLKPDNTVIAKSVTPKRRAEIAAGLAVVQEVLTSLDSGGGVLSLSPTAVAILSAFAAFGIHGVKGNGVDATPGKLSSPLAQPPLPSNLERVNGATGPSSAMRVGDRVEERRGSGVILGASFVVLAFACIALVAGCTPALPSANDVKCVYDDRVAQDGCVAEAGTKEQADSCRAFAKAAAAKCQAAADVADLDAGADQ